MPADKLDEAHVRSIVIAEVSKHLRPILDELKESREWRLGFWSNGSKDRPKGFFQRRIEQDDERNDQIKKDLEKQTEIADRMDDYIKATVVRNEIMDKRKAFWWAFAKWAGGGLVTAIVGLGTWLGPHVVKVIEVLWDDYLQAHPHVTERLKNEVGSDTDPAYASKQKVPQHAGADPNRTY